MSASGKQRNASKGHGVEGGNGNAGQAENSYRQLFNNYQGTGNPNSSGSAAGQTQNSSSAHGQQAQKSSTQASSSQNPTSSGAAGGAGNQKMSALDRLK